MKLSEKYGVPETTIKAMIKDGWISCSAPQYEQVIYTYKKNISEGKSKLQAISNTAEAHKMSDRHVYRVIHKFD